MSERVRWEPDMDMLEARPDFERSVFQVQKFGAEGVVRVELMQTERIADDLARYRIHGYAARRMLERVEVQWPADWWEAAKERWFPAWALARWPVRYERRRMEAAEWLHRRFLDSHGSRVSVEVMKPVPIPATDVPHPTRGAPAMSTPSDTPEDEPQMLDWDALGTPHDSEQRAQLANGRWVRQVTHAPGYHEWVPMRRTLRQWLTDQWHRLTRRTP